MELRYACLAAALALPSSANAQTKLWQNIELGMDYKSVQALYPAAEGQSGVVHKTDAIGIKRFKITSECEGRVNIRFEGGLVKSVDIQAPTGIWAMTRNDPNCDRIILNALTRKYGDPNRMRRDVTLGKWIDTEEKKYVWVTPEGTDIRLELSDTDPEYIITYTAQSLDAVL